MPTLYPLDGKTYRLQPMPARKSFHVHRKLVPLLADMPRGDLRGGAISAILTAIGKMSDEDADFVLDACLACVEVQVVENTFQPIFNKAAGEMQFELDLMTQLTVSARVLMENLQDFTHAVARIFPGAAGVMASISSIFPTTNPG